MMATNVILPALGMSQDTGKIVQWLKAEGERVARGEPLLEIETDKATVEIEAPAAGVLARVAAAAGDEVPVGQVIAVVLAADEEMAQSPPPPAASPLASRIAAEHNLDLSQVQASGRRIQKVDVLTHLQRQESAAPAKLAVAASPKARRLAAAQGRQLATITGSGPAGAVLAVDVLATPAEQAVDVEGDAAAELSPSTLWRIMAERTTQSWTSAPHFYLVREVNAARLLTWRELMLKRTGAQVTYTDLLVKVVAAALRLHPRVNASWHEGRIVLQREVHVGLAVAVAEGLVVPVIHQADTLGLEELARRRVELVAKAQSSQLRPQDISGGTFTISNLGMYGVDAFNAVINQPQAAILAVGRIAERVVPVRGQVVVQPTLVLTLTCDHRVVDGARGAQFLATLAELIEEPLALLG
jgi:pyruvate dehydrogenase E2 component (dihydrolipoamide acetyltransferase)